MNIRPDLQSPSAYGMPYEDVEGERWSGWFIPAPTRPRPLEQFFNRISGNERGTTGRRDGSGLTDSARLKEERYQAPTILFLHSNQGNRGFRLPLVYQMWHRLRANVLLIDYRGYGGNNGKPSQEGLIEDGWYLCVVLDFSFVMELLASPFS